MTATKVTAQLKVRREFLLQLVVLIVALHGLFVIANTLIDQLARRSGSGLSGLNIDIPLLIGLGITYLSTLLRRRKRTAWAAAILIYMFMLGFYASQLSAAAVRHDFDPFELIGKFVLPLVIIGLLLLQRNAFTVRSDVRSFGYSLRVSVLVLLIAFIYGTVGFSLMDDHDFHQELSVPSAMHYTIDQFGLTTGRVLMPHTRRAHLFVDSLSAISIGAVAYAVISLFQPIRSRVAGGHHQLDDARKLLDKYPGNSEDFFKIWPDGKSYVFDDTGEAGIAYMVRGGVALSAGDPFGDKKLAKDVLNKFEDLCYGNDWDPAFIHTEPDWSAFYKRHGYNLQKIGEEAILNLAHFNENVKHTKYFRQINNKFSREKFTAEVLSPPHDKALVARLQTISDEWLERPGREERGFVMGYFSEAYLQQGNVIVARDSAGTIQAFINQIPSYDPDEANFDMLRSTDKSPGNVNDYLMMAFIDYLSGQGTPRLNLGLAPLAGMDDVKDASVIDKSLRFLYSNGDRFYSFSGLTRFKDKYEPEWKDRYAAYKGGIRNFVRGMNALNSAMKVKIKK